MMYSSRKLGTKGQVIVPTLDHSCGYASSVSYSHVDCELSSAFSSDAEDRLCFCQVENICLSRFLADVDRPCVEAFRTLFEQQSFAEGWTSETIGGIFDRQGRRSIVFDVDDTRQAARQRSLPCDPLSPRHNLVRE